MSRLFDDASNEYLQIDSAVLTAVPLTMACWANIDNFDTNQMFMQLADASSNINKIYMYLRNSTARLRVQTQDPLDSDYAQTSTGGSVNTWHHLCGVYAATNDRRAFLDGGGKGTDASDITPSGIDRTVIGRDGDLIPGSYVSGKVAEAAIWNVALTDAEVLILSKGYSPLFVHPQNLVAYWPLVRDTDNDIVGGFNLTAFNTPTVDNHPRIIYPQGITVPVIAAGGGVDAAGQADSASSSAAGFLRSRVAAAQADSLSSSTAGFRRLRVAAAQANSVSSTIAGMRWSMGGIANSTSASTAGFLRLNRPGAAQANSDSQTYAGIPGAAATPATVEELFRNRRFRLSSTYARRSFKGVF